MPDASDEALAAFRERRGRGERDALLADLFTRWRPRLQAMVELRLDRRLRRRLSPSDVIQEAYLEAARRLEKYLDDPQVPFFLWVRRVIADKLHDIHCDHLRAQRRDVRREAPGPAGPEASSVALAGKLAARMQSPSEAADAAERRTALAAAIEKLEAGDREVIALKAFELLDSILLRRRRGERPSTGELEAYVREHPELAERLREVYPMIALLGEEAGLGAGPASSSASPGSAAGSAAPPERLGPYRILREVGRGGMGIVYEAEEEGLGRRVALKVLPFHSLMDPRRIERFRREARAAAALEHPGIVPVYGTGVDGGLHYYAMQFIAGESLEAVILEVQRWVSGERPPESGSRGSAIALRLLRDSTSTSVRTAWGILPPAADEGAPPAGEAFAAEPLAAAAPFSGGKTPPEYHRAVARVGWQVSSALAYAHARGILHRDIKPARREGMGAVGAAEGVNGAQAACRVDPEDGAEVLQTAIRGRAVEAAIRGLNRHSPPRAAADREARRELEAPAAEVLEDPREALAAGAGEVEVAVLVDVGRDQARDRGGKRDRRRSREPAPRVVPQDRHVREGVERREEVRVPIAVQVRRRDAPRLAAQVVDLRRGERAGPIVPVHREVARGDVGGARDGEVEVAVALEVGRGDGEGIEHGPEAARGREGALPLAAEDSDLLVAPGDDQVRARIAVHVEDGGTASAPASRSTRRVCCGRFTHSTCLRVQAKCT